jgi:hypothetical protein
VKSARAAGLICAIAIPAVGFAVSAPAIASASAASASAATARIKVVGIDRNGRQIGRQQATLEASNGQSYTLDGNSLRVPTGTYLVAAAVATGSVSDTLVVRQVRISGSQTIRMSAAGGKLVRLTLTGVSGSPATDQVNACLGTQTGAETPVAAGGGSGVQLYAVPFRSRDVGFSYLASWTGAQAGYAITGSSADGIPSRLGFTQHVGDLARLTLNIRSGVNPGTANLWEIGPGNYYQALCSPGQVDGQMTTPFSITQHVTAGEWTSETDTEYQTTSGVTDFTGFNYLVRKLAARHGYTQTFGAAVAGPGAVQPAIDGNLFRFNASDLFDVPGMLGDDQCCARSTVTLGRDSHVQWTGHLNEWRGNTYFQRTVTQAGWYNFDVSASRWNPHGTEPADLLSPRATIDWHFYVRPVPPAGNQVDFPVTITTFTPRGLSMSNQATPGATTTVGFRIVRNGDSGNPSPHYALRTVRVLASFNDGITWHQLSVSDKGGSWTAVVHDPASGYVTLRSVVADSRGDRTTQTIYRAYAIAS